MPSAYTLSLYFRVVDSHFSTLFERKSADLLKLADNVGEEYCRERTHQVSTAVAAEVPELVSPLTDTIKTQILQEAKQQFKLDLQYANVAMSDAANFTSKNNPQGNYINTSGNYFQQR